jgi:hypothetical protein
VTCINDKPAHLLDGLPEVEVAREINALEHLDVTLFIWVADMNVIIWNVDHASVFYLVDGMIPNECHTPPFCHKDYIIPLQELDKSYR